MNIPSVRYVVLGLLCTASPTWAQRVADVATSASLAMESSHTTSARPDANAIFSRKVSVNIRQMQLRDAIAALAKSSGVRIHYRMELVEASSRLVTLHVKDETLGAALSEMLEGTTLRAVEVAPGVLALQSAAPLRADGIIVGKVVHATTKRPVSGVTIVLDGVVQKVTSGSDGEFRIPAASGDHTLTLRMVGFMRREQIVKVPDEQTVRVDMVLEPSASVLDQVVVTGTVVATERKALPVPITVITAKDIEARGITRIEQLFRGEVPGVVALETGVMQYTAGRSDQSIVQGSQLFARGSASLSGASNPLKTYVDGVEVFGVQYLSTIDPQSIERIEIITGPQAATLYGSGAMGGVMQIFTKKGSAGSRPNVTLNIRYGMLESNFSSARTPSHNHTLDVNGSTESGVSYAGSLSHQYTGQWQPALFSRSYGGQVGATLRQGGFTASGSAGSRTNRNGTVANFGNISFCPLSALVGGCQSVGSPVAHKLNADGDLIINYGPRIVSQDILSASTQTVALNVDYQAVPIWQHHLTVGRNQTLQHMKSGQPMFRSVSDSTWGDRTQNGLRTTVSYNTTLLPRFGILSSALTLGFDGAWGEELQLQRAWSATTVASPRSLGSWARESNSYGGFGSWRIGVWDRAFVTFGVRGERNPNYGKERKIDWTPTVGLAYTVEHGAWSVKFAGSDGRATKPPPVGSREDEIHADGSWLMPSSWIWVVGNPKLRPEYSRGPQGSIEVYYGNLGSFTITHYQQTVTDLLQKVMVDTLLIWNTLSNSNLVVGQFQWQNTAKIRQKGWEGTGSLNLGMFSLKGTWSWNDSRVVSINPNEGADYFGSSGLPYRPGDVFSIAPSHTANAVIGYALGGTSISVVANYVGASLGNSSGDVEAIRDYYSRLKMYTSTQQYVVNRRKPGYTKTDIAASTRLTSWVTATLNVVNASNSFASDVSGMFPSLGRQTLIGMSLRYPMSR